MTAQYDFSKVSTAFKVILFMLCTLRICVRSSGLEIFIDMEYTLRTIVSVYRVQTVGVHALYTINNCLCLQLAGL